MYERIPVVELDIPLTNDIFARNVIRELSGALEEIAGIEEATGFVSLVGQEIGQQINQLYLDAYELPRLDPEMIADVLVDLKRRIDGQFYVLEHSEEKIVLGNDQCPFGDKVKNRESLCMMTSNVFGTITAGATGFAKVSLNETIARGDRRCHVVVYLRSGPEADAAEGRTYFD